MFNFVMLFLCICNTILLSKETNKQQKALIHVVFQFALSDFLVLDALTNHVLFDMKHNAQHLGCY